MTTEIRVVIAEGIVVRPGDTLVIVLPDHMEADEVQQAYALVRDRLPDNAYALVVGGGIQVHVLRDNESEVPDDLAG